MIDMAYVYENCNVSSKREQVSLVLDISTIKKGVHESPKMDNLDPSSPIYFPRSKF